MIKSALKILCLASLILSCKSEPKHNDTINIETSYKLGKAVYTEFCINCHLDNGQGVLKAFPPLADSDYLENNQLESIKGLKFGMHKEITVNGVVYNGNMAKQGLTDREIADVMNYINNSWGNDYGTFITVEEVSKVQP